MLSKILSKTAPKTLKTQPKLRPTPDRLSPGCLLMTITFIVATFSFNLSGIFASVNVSAKAANCDDVRLIFARGSGEALGGPSASAWRDEITAAIGDNLNSLKYGFYELGSQPQRGHQYPAVAVSDSLSGYINLVGAYFSGGEAFRFGESVEEGIKELLAYIGDTSAACPNTKFVLGGYSQGAMILSASLPALDANKIIYVSTFGDPKLYLPEGKSTILGAIPKTPDACRGLNLSPYRISVPDCRAYEGILGSYRPYQPEDYAGKLGTWCNEKDIMCSSGSSISDHTSYASSNLYRDAASVIARKLTAAFPDKTNWVEALRKAKHNVAFVIDTTISMTNVIEQYKTEAKALAAQVKADGGDVALFEYRDLRDGFEPRKLCDLSCELSDFSNLVDGLTVAGGGDIPESALSALLFAMNGLDWQSGTTKSIVLLTDAEYHNPDRDDTTFDDVVRRSLEIDPVNIYVVAPSNRGVDYTYRKLTAATSGEVFTLGRVDPSSITSTIFERPIARLALSSYAGQVGDEFYFDASASYAADGSPLQFEWDLDGDGQFELSTSDSTLHHAYAQATDHFIQVRVTDGSGKSSTMSAKVSIFSAPSALTSITELTATPNPDGTTSVAFRSDGAKALLSTGELVQGFVEIDENGAGGFVIQDISDDLTIALTPYSSTGERGTSRSILIPANASHDANTDASNNTNNQPIPETALPKAPNTGIIAREYR